MGRCEDKAPDWANFDANFSCIQDGKFVDLEQGGTDVSANYTGGHDSSITPIEDAFYLKSMCPVNVHWTVGAEHRSDGQFEESFDDKGPIGWYSPERRGFRCNHYNSSDPKFTTPYRFKYCSKMGVGETYEIHWPHSCMGACGSADQYQSPFQDGVFCDFTGTKPTPQDLANCVGVQAQVFTVVNDERYYYPDLIRGMIVQGGVGKKLTIYTGSSTGRSFDNENCSAFSPITWQVDRECHLISASSFDKLCADMMSQFDDMSSDTEPHGARELVNRNFTSKYRYIGTTATTTQAV